MDETCSMDDLYMMIYMSKIAQKKVEGHWRRGKSAYKMN